MARLASGDRIERGGQYRDLVHAPPQVNVLGGGGGTDHRHLECMALACRTVSVAMPA